MFDALIPRAWTEFVLQLDPGEYWLAVGFLVLVALGAFWAIFHFFYRARFIEDTPTSRVRSAAQGYVELNGVGRLMTGPPIISPPRKSSICSISPPTSNCSYFRYRPMQVRF